jgi:hypothetical protein
MKRATLSALMTVLLPWSLTSDPLRAEPGPNLRHQHSSPQDHHGSHSHHGAHTHHGPLYTPSGMLLGVYARTTHDGLKIVGTIPGYSAEGRLFPGDVLLRATATEMPVLSIRSHSLMEQAKSRIGPFREAAVEFFRPGAGLMYAWVTFEPIDGDAHPHLHGPQPAFGPEQAHAAARRGNPFDKPHKLSPSSNGTTSAAPQKFQAEFRLESEKPGARALFNKREGAPSK